MNTVNAEYGRMKAAFWEIWPLVMEGLESDLMHNRPKEFWGNVRKLRNAIDSQIEPDLAVVPALGVCVPVPHGPVTAKSRQEATRRPTKARSAAVGTVKALGKCQDCQFWKVGGPGVFACQNELSPHWMKNSGAGWTCEKFEKERGNQAMTPNAQHMLSLFETEPEKFWLEVAKGVNKPDDEKAGVWFHSCSGSQTDSDGRRACLKCGHRYSLGDGSLSCLVPPKLTGSPADIARKLIESLSGQERIAYVEAALALCWPVGKMVSDWLIFDIRPYQIVACCLVALDLWASGKEAKL